MNHEFKFEKLVLDCVAEKLQTVKKWLGLQKDKNIILDFTNISYIDSAGVAMLVELKRYVHFELKKNLNFKISDQVMQMVKFYDLDGLLNE